MQNNSNNQVKKKDEYGILSYNLDTRNELLKRKGTKKYYLYNDTFYSPIGSVSSFKDRSVESSTDEKGISGYTFDKETNYSKEIITKYLNGLTNVISFTSSGFSDGDMVRWKGKRNDYIALEVSSSGVLNTDLGANTVIMNGGYDNSVSDDKRVLGQTIYNSLSSFYSNSKYYISHNRSTDGKSITILSGKFDGLRENGKIADLVSYQNGLGKGSYQGKRVYNVWGEGDAVRTYAFVNTDESNGSNWFASDNGVNEFSAYMHSVTGSNNLLKKTDELYNSHKIKTIFSRFKTSDDDGYNDYADSFDSAKVVGLGNPHGRGLLSLGVNSVEGQYLNKTNGYLNPYCRSWTYHHQYHKVKNLIRPLPETTLEDGSTRDGYSINIKYRSRIHGKDSGDKYLRDNTVLQKSGFVRITPSVSELVGNVDKNKLGEGKAAFNSENSYKNYMNLKKYMFSLENLAWSDGTSNNLRNLSMEQLGPNNGRIMWFPPYNLDFKENVSVKWNQHEFIGRGENIYTYANTTRKGTLSFSLLIDHPVIVNSASNGKYGGAKPDEDPEGDILRFFAGCQIIDPDADIDPNIPEDIRQKYIEQYYKNIVPVTSKKVEAPSDDPTPENSIDTEITFYVFFPNNYSGMWNGGNNLVSKAYDGGSAPSEYLNNAPIDKNWYLYLLIGSGATIPSGFTFSSGSTIDEDGILGYEMSSKGISNNGSDNKSGLLYANKTAGVEQADYFTYLTGGSKDFGTLEFKYLVDYDLRQGGLGKNGYSDPNSFHLNSKLSKINKEGFTATHSFSEVFTVLYKNEILKESDGEKKYEAIKKKIADMSDGKDSLKRMEELESLFYSGSPIYKSVTVYGGATKQDPNNSKTLAFRRATTVKATLNEILNCDASIDSDYVIPETLKGKSDNTILEAKKERFAKVKMVVTTKINKEGTDAKSNASVSETYELNRASYGSNGSGYNSNGNGYDGDNTTTDNVTTYQTISTYDEDELAAMDSAKRRYDDEYRFFRRLREDSPLIYKRLVDKFKYFNPAFHSLSPEGFNARLTFLQQCTRQGHTISASENNKNSNVYQATAGNLAFGKMPVCVLRIGDFINTRVIIESMSIDYKNGDSMQWDLNEEGVGVQPMYANISLNIAILGGQSLDGPISRLQNAVTFNYYANAPAYDDRADRILNNNDGTVTYTHLFTPFSNDES